MGVAAPDRVDRGPSISTTCCALAIAHLYGNSPLSRMDVTDVLAMKRSSSFTFAKLDALNQPPLSTEDIQAEIDAARAERRSPHAEWRFTAPTPGSARREKHPATPANHAADGSRDVR